MPRTRKLTAELDVVLYSTLQPEKIDWLWPGRIPRGKVTVISGQPGLGKSLLALDIAARVTRGGDWPDQPRPVSSPANDSETQPAATTDVSPASPAPLAGPLAGLLLACRPVAMNPPDSVLLLNAEDHLGNSVRPALAAARADFYGVLGIKGLYSRERHHKAPPQGIDLLRYLPLLRKQLNETRKVRLMVIDPFFAYWGKIGPHPTRTTHRVATELSGLAAEFNIAIIVITDHRHNGLPSRTTWSVQRSWDDDDLRLWTPTQFHYGPVPTGLTYRVQNNHITWEPGPLGAPRNPDGTTQNLTAKEWLSYFLSNGPREATEAYTTGEALGFSKQQLWRAKDDLCVTARKATGVSHGKWTWELPKQQK